MNYLSNEITENDTLARVRVCVCILRCKNNFHLAINCHGLELWHRHVHAHCSSTAVTAGEVPAYISVEILDKFSP